jgi:ATP-dependent RNA helicase DeaD
VIQTLADALEQRGYTDLTPVQQAVTDPGLESSDLLVSAQTGSGKTVGFGLAIAPTLLGDAPQFERACKPLALIIAPTRELALQVKRELAWLYAKTGAVVASCVGGMDMRDERRSLERGAHIVVATPGRLRDHIQRGSLVMDDLRAVVLDEADEMLDLGFREDLEFILGEAPEGRRTLMFSATVPRAIANLAKSYQKDAVRVTTTAEASQHADIEYRALNVAPRDAENAIVNVLRFYEAPNALVFCNTREMVNRLTTRFSNRGFSVVALSGELSQNERSHALQAMRDGRARVCIATDVAARGIDLPNLELVIHADLPSNSETLLHRSGRTGRAGRKGVSVLIVPGKVRKKAERLLAGAKVNAAWGDAPSADMVLERDEERLLSDPVWTQELTEAEQAAAQKLLTHYTAETIAAAYLRLYHSRQSAPEELADSGAAAGPRVHAEFGPSTWFTVTGGRNQNVEPGRLLPKLCKAGGLTRDDIGAIRVQQDETYVEIRGAAVAGFLSAIGKDMIIDPVTAVKPLDVAPEIARKAPTKFEASKRFKKAYEGKPKGKFRKGGRSDHAETTQRFDAPASEPVGAKRPKPKRWKPEDTRPEGVVEPLKPRKPSTKGGKPGVKPHRKGGKPGFAKKSKPAKGGDAVLKRGK